MEQFECIIDKWGNIRVSSGWVYQFSSQTLSEIGSDSGFFPGDIRPSEFPGMAATQPVSITFIGGSGRGLMATPSDALANPAAKTTISGIYQPDWADSFRHFLTSSTTLIFTSGADAEIHDGTGAVANWSSGDDAPLGVYAATTYGKDTYNAGAAFDITVTEELVSGRLPASAEAEVSAGTAVGGVYSATSNQTFENADSDWTITIDAAGVALLKYLTNTVATRTVVDLWDDPSGIYESSTYGETNYNGGDPFTVKVTQRNAFPRDGFAIVQCNISGGDLVSVSKPFFSQSIPTNTSTELYIPIFKSDGSTIAQQLHTGMLIIP